MSKAPPRRRPVPDPPGRRIYAHIQSGQFACPRCERLVLFGPSRSKYGRTGSLGKGYDIRRGVYHCPTCGYRAVLGIVFWPLVAWRHPRSTPVPADHVPTPAQAEEIRAVLDASYEGPTFPSGGDRRAWVSNVECTCERPCAVHGAVEGGIDD